MSQAMDGLDERLTNWRRWLRSSGGAGGQCASIEGDYRSPQSKHWYPPGPRPLEARAADAWDITLAVITLPLRLHLVLKLKYVIQFEDKTIASIFREDGIEPRCKTTDVPAIEWEARCELIEALAMPVVIRRTRAVARARRIIDKAEDMLVD